jgi:hypothetical protein
MFKPTFNTYCGAISNLVLIFYTLSTYEIFFETIT